MSSLIKKRLRVLFISRELIAGDLAYILKREGCEVKLFIQDSQEKECFDGMVDKTNYWKKNLAWVGKDGLIIFDDVGYGKIQDSLRRNGYLVIGGSAEGDNLELDRTYGQKVLTDYGISSLDFKTKIFSVSSAVDFVSKQKGRWVIKANDHNNELTYVGKLKNGSDVVDVLESYKNKFGSNYQISLQKYVDGVEVAIGRFFNGNNWVGPSVINFEHKHFGNNDLGPLGGETGTLMWYEPNENNKLFQNTLAKLASHLKKEGYIGYIDINCIVNKNKAYPLEITSRFGSSTIETQAELHISHWKDFLQALANGKTFKLKYKKGYAINVALTTPPFPYKTKDKKIGSAGLKIYFAKNLTKANWQSIHYEGIARQNDNYYVAGNSGYVIYVTGNGSTIQKARKKVYNIIDKIIIPKMFYRSDIGLRFINRDQKLLKKWRWI